MECPHLSTSTETGVLTIQELRKLQVTCFMFKVDKGLMTPYFHSVFFVQMRMFILRIPGLLLAII